MLNPEAAAAEVSGDEVAVPMPARSYEAPVAVIRRPYELAEVEKVDSPAGAAGDDWYRYVLVRRTSRIIGFRRGSLWEVTEYALGCIEAFNDRNLNSRGTYPLKISPWR
jgi:hypothetical protein